MKPLKLSARETPRDPVEALVAKIARLTTWRERCEAEAREDFGLTSREDIEAHVRGAQTDVDYLAAQDETLERLITEARLALAGRAAP